MGTTLQPVLEPINRIIHTDREVQIEWREEIGINHLVITLQSMGKLRLSHHLQGIIPSLGSLKTQLAGISYQVVGSLERTQGVALGSLITQSQLQLVVPLHLLLVVVICLHGDASQHRIVALTTLIPVARNIILQELEVIITVDGPEVRTGDDQIHRSRLYLYRLRSHLLNEVRMVFLRLGRRIERCPHLSESGFRSPYQVGTSEIDIHQGSIQLRLERIPHFTLWRDAQQMIGRRMIESERSKEQAETAVIGFQPD